MTALYKRLRAAVGEHNGLTDKQLEQHVRGVEQVVLKARQRARRAQRARRTAA